MNGAEFHSATQTFNGGIPFIHLPNAVEPFEIDDLRSVCKLSLTQQGMLATLRRWGPWRIPYAEGLKSSECLREHLRTDFVDWYFRSLRLKKTYFLFRSLQSGQMFDWEVIAPEIDGMSDLRFCSWPKRLNKPMPRPDSSYLQDRTRRRALSKEYFEIEEARSMAKEMLAGMIDAGLSELRLRFLFRPDLNTYQTDTPPDQALCLEDACYLLLRDLAGSLSGARFCKSPGCGRQIDQSRRRDAQTCPNAACKKAYQRLKESRSEEAVK